MTGRPLFRIAAWCVVGTSVMGDPVGAQSRLDFVGVHAGAIMSAGENSETLVGLHAGVPLSGSLSLVAAFDLRSDFPDDPTDAWTGTAWWGYATVRTDLPWPIRFVSVGLGVAIARASADDPTRSLQLSSTELRETLVVGMSRRVWRVRPFADLHLVGAIRSPTEPGSHLTAGIGVTTR